MAFSTEHDLHWKFTPHLLQPPEEQQEEMAAIGPGINLPPCKTHRLVEVAELVASALSSVSHREKLALALKKEGHIPKLLKLFQICEELQLRWALQHLLAIVQGILWLNQAALLEVMLSQECLMDVVRCLKYGPSLAQPKWKQQLLQKTTKPKELLPIQDPELQQNFHQATGLGEGSLSSLTSFISCNKEEIFHVCVPFWFLAQLADGATGAHQQWELVNFLKDFCAFSLMFHQKGEAFLQSWAKLGLLPALEILLVRLTLSGIFAGYRPHPCAHAMMLCHHAAAFGRANQVMELLQTLLDPEKHLATAEDIFLFFFFSLLLIEGITFPVDDYQTAQLLVLILELLSFCVMWRKEHMRGCILQWYLLRRLVLLINSQHTFLALSALHFLRKIIGLKDELYTHSITQGNLLAPLVQALLDSAAASNLLHWAVLELFEFLRLEDCKSLVAHVIENFYPVLECILCADIPGKRKYERDKHEQSRVCTGRPQSLCWEPDRDCPMTGLLLAFLFARGGWHWPWLPFWSKTSRMRGKPPLPFLAAPWSRAALAQGVPCSSQKALSFPRAASCSVPAREDSACLGLSQQLLSLTERTQAPMELDCLPKWAPLPPNSGSHC
uniref:Serine/threonine-protein phosphatase 4 regulatory subunit 3-like central domain-containing protein n=1 Tax=Serinus canaria TaxID=9135 RepID=A0A8C9MUJ2_SERCA